MTMAFTPFSAATRYRNVSGLHQFDTKFTMTILNHDVRLLVGHGATKMSIHSLIFTKCCPFVRLLLPWLLNLSDDFRRYQLCI